MSEAAEQQRRSGGKCKVTSVKEIHGTQPKQGNSYDFNSYCVCFCCYTKHSEIFIIIININVSVGAKVHSSDIIFLLGWPPILLSNLSTPSIPADLLSHSMAICSKWVHSYRTFIFRSAIVLFIFNISRLITTLWSRTSSVNVLRFFPLQNLISSVSVLILSAKFPQNYDRMTVTIAVHFLNPASLLFFVRVYFLFPNI